MEEFLAMLEALKEDETYKGRMPVFAVEEPGFDYDFDAAVRYLKSLQDDEHFLLLSMDDHNMHYYEDEFWWSEAMLKAIEDREFYFCEEYAKRFAK